ncbi:hypothetical protein, partial [uncultured Flavonifractor sp.]|uniref:hypothetical protein n=1 Tax=uncultured Flavonifractor sp. TaxID=1193534 RepID=UPI00266FD7F8
PRTLAFVKHFFLISFRKAVQVPLGFFRFWSDFHALSQGAQIEYHSQSHLSTPFSLSALFFFRSSFVILWLRQGWNYATLFLLQNPTERGHTHAH